MSVFVNDGGTGREPDEVPDMDEFNALTACVEWLEKTLRDVLAHGVMLGDGTIVRVVVKELP